MTNIHYLLITLLPIRVIAGLHALHGVWYTQSSPAPAGPPSWANNTMTPNPNFISLQIAPTMQVDLDIHCSNETKRMVIDTARPYSWIAAGTLQCRNETTILDSWKRSFSESTLAYLEGGTTLRGYTMPWLTIPMKGPNILILDALLAAESITVLSVAETFQNATGSFGLIPPANISACNSLSPYTFKRNETLLDQPAWINIAAFRDRAGILRFGANDDLDHVTTVAPDVTVPLIQPVNPDDACSNAIKVDSITFRGTNATTYKLPPEAIIDSISRFNLVPAPIALMIHDSYRSAGNATYARTLISTTLFNDFGQMTIDCNATLPEYPVTINIANASFPISHKDMIVRAKNGQCLSAFQPQWNTNDTMRLGWPFLHNVGLTYMLAGNGSTVGIKARVNKTVTPPIPVL